MTSTAGLYTQYRETMLRASKKYYQEHKEEVLRRQKMQSCEQTIKAQQVLGGKCVICGNDDPEVLEFDHINNDGAQHRREPGNSKLNNSPSYWILSHADEARERMQVLCANCHRKKHNQLVGCRSNAAI